MRTLTVELSQDTAVEPEFTFTTSPVTVRFVLSDGSPVAGVPVVFAGSRWAEFGTTDADGTVTREFLESSRLRVRATHENLTVELSQDTAVEPEFTFTTSPVTVRFVLSDGTPVAGVPVVFAGSRWAEFGTTDADGTVIREFLESSRLRVRATHENLTVELSQDTAVEPEFTFTTSPVTVRFVLSDGTPVAGVPVVFAGSRWAEFGTTDADGTVKREFLESSRLRVRATHESLTVEQSQDTAVEPEFTFTTGRLIQGPGEIVTQFRGSRWTTFASGIELLSGALTLRLDTGVETTVDVIAGETIIVPSGNLVPPTTTTTTTTTVPPTTTTTVPPTTTTTVPPTTTTTTTVPPTTTTTVPPTTTTTVPPHDDHDHDRPANDDHDDGGADHHDDGGADHHDDGGADHHHDGGADHHHDRPAHDDHDHHHDHDDHHDHHHDGSAADRRDHLHDDVDRRARSDRSADPGGCRPGNVRDRCAAGDPVDRPAVRRSADRRWHRHERDHDHERRSITDDWHGHGDRRTAARSRPPLEHCSRTGRRARCSTAS